MTTAHTPGPWEAFHIDVRTAGRRSRVVCWAGSPSVALRRARANARLIAAAPDLLAALKALHACHRAFSGAENWTALDDEARAAAEAAIAKATEGRA